MLEKEGGYKHDHNERINEKLYELKPCVNVARLFAVIFLVIGRYLAYSFLLRLSFDLGLSVLKNFEVFVLRVYGGLFLFLVYDVRRLDLVAEIFDLECVRKMLNSDVFSVLFIF